MADTIKYDVVIVGAGVAGSIIAYQLGLAGRKVLILESGRAVPASREDYMERFYMQVAKTPESPYGNNPNAPRATVLQLTKNGGWKDPIGKYLDQSDSTLPFSSTYERQGGGTMWHWLGSSFRLLPNDFQLKTKYDHGVDWPIGYSELGSPSSGKTSAYYDDAEKEIGVAADVIDQSYLGVTFTPNYRYPNPAIPPTLTDKFFSQTINDHGLKFDNIPVQVCPTPAGRNSRPYDGRRVCAGNTNCIPICPIQAKYDPTITLNKALATGNVTILYQAVASNVKLDVDCKSVIGIDYITYDDPDRKSPSGTGTAVGRRYVIAAHAIETPKLLLNSSKQLNAGVANSSGQVGRNLMDHPLYLRWGLTPEPTFPFRGPLTTSGIESLRDGSFRKDRAAWRVELGNEGWNFAAFDPEVTTFDFVDGTNANGNNPPLRPSESSPKWFGRKLLQQLNSIFTRQFRFGFLVEQSPCEDNTVTLSTLKDDLGLPRPKIKYNLSDYTKRGFVAAEKLADQVFAAANVAQSGIPANMQQDAGYFTYEDPDTKLIHQFEFFGAGHIVGTYRMGPNCNTSVVDRFQRSWDHPNLFLVGSGVFPTVATGNPTLTIAALAFWAADTINSDL
jgi:choline dehydrogenase-like flavoprotein